MTTGLFETILVRDGVPVRLEAHLARLGAADPGLAERCRAAARGRALARMRVIFAGGFTGVETEPFAGYPEALYRDGARAEIAPERGHPLGPLAGRKVYPYDVMNDLRAAARAAGHVDRILLDLDGALLEGCASNLFLVRAGVLVTPPLSRPILPGVTRAAVLAAGLPAEERDLFEADLATAEEAFLTGSLMEVLPLRALGDVRFRPGPVAASLRAALRGRGPHSAAPPSARNPT